MFDSLLVLLIDCLPKFLELVISPSIVLKVIVIVVLIIILFLLLRAALYLATRAVL